MQPASLSSCRWKPCSCNGCWTASRGRAPDHDDDPAAAAGGAPPPSAQPGSRPAGTASLAPRGAGIESGSPSVHDDAYAEAAEGLRRAAGGCDDGRAQSDGSGGIGGAAKRRRKVANGSAPPIDADEVESLADDDGDGPADGADDVSSGRVADCVAGDDDAHDASMLDGHETTKAKDKSSPAAPAGAAGVAARKQRMEATKAARGRGRGSGRGRRGRGESTGNSGRASASLRRGRSRTA